MVTLNEALIKTKTRVERLEEVRNLNVCGQGIDDVSVLQQAPNIEVLSLSVNKISTLRHFIFCGQIKQLYLRANAIADLAEVRYLMPLQHLSVLWLADNPCTKLPHYRAFVVANLPKLENLDNVPINEADRRAAKGVRRLQPATPADVLAEDQEAAQQLQRQQVAEALEGAARQDSQHSSAPQQQQQQQQQGLSSAPSPRSSPPAAMGSVQQGSTPRPVVSPEPGAQPTPHHRRTSDTCSSLQTGGGSAAHSRPPTSARASRSSITGYTTPRQSSGVVSATGSYRSSPEPCMDHGLQQLKGYSVTPRDLGNASSIGMSVTAGPGEVHGHDTPRQLYGEHIGCAGTRQQQQQQHCEDATMPRRMWPPAGIEQPCQHTGCPGCHPQQGQAPQWRGAEAAGGACGTSPSASRTNVLYAVMALLGELDASGLGIVQREVQLRLTEHQ